MVFSMLLTRYRPAVWCACVLAGALLGACNRSSQGQQAPAPAASTPAAVSPRLYVSDETGASIVVIDPAKGEVVQRIAVGKRPRGVRLSRDGARLFVALSGSPIAGPGVDESKLPPADRAADGIGVVDLASGTVVRKYESGQDPEAFDISKDGALVFVSNEETAEMSVLDLESGTVTHRVNVGEEPEGVTVRPDGRMVYVTCEATNEVVAVDISSYKVVARIESGPRPRSIEFDKQGTVGFITSENGAAVTVFDPATHKVTSTIQIPGTEGTPMAPRPMGLALSPDGRQMFVSLGRAKSVAVIDVATRAFVRSIEDVGTRPWGIAVSPDGSKVYTANGPSGDVSVVDVASGKIEKRIAVGGSPWGIAVGTAR
jgi:YVTN family beta-propeller protein